MVETHGERELRLSDRHFGVIEEYQKLTRNPGIQVGKAQDVLVTGSMTYMLEFTMGFSLSSMNLGAPFVRLEERDDRTDNSAKGAAGALPVKSDSCHCPVTMSGTVYPLKIMLQWRAATLGAMNAEMGIYELTSRR